MSLHNGTAAETERKRMLEHEGHIILNLGQNQYGDLEDVCHDIIIETHSSTLREQCTETLQNLGYTLKHVGRTVKGKGWMNEVSVLFFSADGDVK